MLIELTRTSGEHVCVNVEQICWFYELGNGQTYLVFNAERSNLTVKESYTVVKKLIKLSTKIHGLGSYEKDNDDLAYEVRSKLASKSIPG